MNIDTAATTNTTKTPKAAKTGQLPLAPEDGPEQLEGGGQGTVEIHAASEFHREKIAAGMLHRHLPAGPEYIITVSYRAIGNNQRRDAEKAAYPDAWKNHFSGDNWRREPSIVVRRVSEKGGTPSIVGVFSDVEILGESRFQYNGNRGIVKSDGTTAHLTFHTSGAVNAYTNPEDRKIETADAYASLGC